MMTILKFEYLKSFDSDLKTQLSVDKKYLPISKKLVVLLRDVNPFLDSIEKRIKEIESRHLVTSLNINKSYAENIENYQRSLKVLEDKNHAEIEKSNKLKIQKTQELNTNLKSLLEQIEFRINEANEKAVLLMQSADMNYKRDVSSFHKIMQDTRKQYQLTTQAIEEEKKLTIERAALTYDEKISEIDALILNYEQEINEQIDRIRQESQISSKENDDVYLNIKNTYTELSINLNKKINELKKIYNQTLNSVNKEYQNKLKPIEKEIEVLKESYQEAQRKALNSYSDKLNSLNVVFDVQKQSYEAKKEKIIYEANEAITLLNSKLSAYRETTSKEKLNTSREMRDQMKSLETAYDKEKLNHQLTRKLNMMDNELNKQIIRTNKDILEKHRNQQQRLFMHDQLHLKEINDWRLKKVLFEYEKKQEFAKIDLNFHHNMQTSEQKLKLHEATYAYKKEILQLTHTKDLLPLEYQLAIAAAVQERELNLLGNDAHLLLAEYKKKEQSLLFELKKKQAGIELEREKAKLLYQADTQVLNVTIQLEMEKAKAKRDFELNEQDIRIELSRLILNKTNDQIKNELTQTIRDIELEREILYIVNKDELEQYKADQQKEQLKRLFVINEARHKNQQRISMEKASRMMKSYQNELELNQEFAECFMSIMRMSYTHDLAFKTVLLELYHLPSHPEVLKGVLKSLIELHQSVNQSLISILEHFQSLDQSFYVKKIEDMTGYKYMLKHEDMMNFYEQEIEKIEEKRKDIQKDIKSLEETFFQNQSDLERNNAFINQLLKVSQHIKTNELKSEHKHHDIKENQKLLSNHEHEIKRIKQNLVRIEKEIDEKHALIIPLDQQLEKIKAKQIEAEKTLEKAKHDEASIFYRYLSKNQGIYSSLAIEINMHYNELILFYQQLVEEVYITDSILEQLIKKLNHAFDLHEKKISTTQQAFLNLMLNFYQRNEKEQNELIRGFRHSTESLILGLNQNYKSSLKLLDLEHKKRIHEKNRLIGMQHEKTKKKRELEKITYQKKLALDQMTLKELETKIFQNNTKGLQELKILNENQVSIATQYANEHEQAISGVRDNYLKQINLYDASIATLEKNHVGLDLQLLAKNNVILTKYQQSYEKSLLALSQKNEHYDELRNKAKEAQINREKLFENMLKRMNQKRENELRNIQNHLKRFTQSTKYDQNVTLNKEVRVLRKSHRFKLKMLNLN